VSKPKVSTGGVRVISKVIERPVEETVTLREEHVETERRSADRTLDADEANAAFKEKTIEVMGSVDAPLSYTEFHWPGATPGPRAPTPSAAPTRPRTGRRARPGYARPAAPKGAAPRACSRADLLRDRPHRRPCRGVGARMLSDHPNRALAQLGRVRLHGLLRRFHSTTLANVGASGKPGAV
jgi:hypothetical protein